MGIASDRSARAAAISAFLQRETWNVPFPSGRVGSPSGWAASRPDSSRGGLRCEALMPRGRCDCAIERTTAPRGCVGGRTTNAKVDENQQTQSALSASDGARRSRREGLPAGVRPRIEHPPGAWEGYKIEGQLTTTAPDRSQGGPPRGRVSAGGRESLQYGTGCKLPRAPGSGRLGPRWQNPWGDSQRRGRSRHRSRRWRRRT